MATQFALAAYRAASGDLRSSFDGDGKVLTSFGSGMAASAYAVVPDADDVVVVGGADVDISGVRKACFALAMYRVDGTLAPFFGSAGLVTTDFASRRSATALAVACSADAHFAVAGYARNDTGVQEVAVARYHHDGGLDTDFDHDGKVLTTIPGCSMAVATDVAFYGYDRIVVAGRAFKDGKKVWFVARYTAAGALDTTFNTTGIVIREFAGSATVGGVVVDASDRIVVAGNAVVDGSTQFAVARYLADGSEDTSFGDAGVATTDFRSCAIDDGRALAIDPSTGKIVVGGYARHTASGKDVFALARYSDDGTLDPSFDGDGKVLTDFRSGEGERLESVAIDSSGRAVAAGWTVVGGVEQFAVARYTTVGALDTTFGGDGKVLTRFASMQGVRGSGVCIRSDGTIIVVGTATPRP